LLYKEKRGVFRITQTIDSRVCTRQGKGRNRVTFEGLIGERHQVPERGRRPEKANKVKPEKAQQGPAKRRPRDYRRNWMLQKHVRQGVGTEGGSEKKQGEKERDAKKREI